MPLEITDKGPRFYGSVTVGERGQVVIPAEARHQQAIDPGSKLLVFSGPDARVIFMVKVELISEFLQTFSSAVQSLEQALRESDGRRSPAGKPE